MARTITLIFVVFICSLFSCSENSSSKQQQIIEKEPNNTYPEATNIELGQKYEGVINGSFNMEEKSYCDIDIYLLEVRKGLTYTINFNSSNSNFAPFVELLSANGLLKKVVFESGKEAAISFNALNDDYLYFIFGDVRNLESEQCFTDKNYTYSFEISKEHPCDRDNIPLLKVNKEIDMYNLNGDIALFRANELDGTFGISAQNKNNETDRKMMLIDCFSESIVAYSDDLDSESNMLEPYIYFTSTGIHNYIISVENWITDFTKKEADAFTLETENQDMTKEFEPNDLPGYANIFSREKTEGFLDIELHLIDGQMEEDIDFFKDTALSGTVYEINITLPKGGSLNQNLYIVSTSLSSKELRKVSINNAAIGENSTTDIFVPTNGSLYFLFQGKNLPYSFSTRNYAPDKTLLTDAENQFQLKKCESVYANYQPSETKKTRITTSYKDAPTELGIYHKTGNPYILKSITEKNTVVILPEKENKNLVVSGAIGVCNPGEENILKITVAEEEFKLEENEVTTETPVLASLNKSYIGFFNSFERILTNNFQLSIEEDKTLHLQTMYFDKKDNPGIDTVIRIKDENDNIIAENDDKDPLFLTNKYSYLSFSVKKGKKYTIEVKPFMDEELSDPDYMNIIAYYILDISAE